MTKTKCKHPQQIKTVKVGSQTKHINKKNLLEIYLNVKTKK